MIDIHNRTDIREKLSQLQPEAVPKFGIMPPQHMVEHLLLVLRVSSNELSYELYYPEEKAAQAKAAIIYTEAELPVGFKAPMLPEGLMELEFGNLKTAIDQLLKGLDNFDSYFKENPEAQMIHPVMGTFNHAEWITFHNKHFTHHFKQFGLI